MNLFAKLIELQNSFYNEFGTDGTREYHLWHCASRTPNPSSLPDHGFEF